MCQTCYDRGYKDYPNWVGSAPHPDYYQKGFNAHQAETGEAGHYAESVDFCETCYDRGYEDGVKDYWSPPTTPKSGHKESYKEGFNSVKAKRDDKERKEEEYQQQRQRQQRREEPRTEQVIRQITSSNSDEYIKNLLIKFGSYLVAGALILFAVLWIVSMVVILSLINLATISLVAGLTKKDWSKALFSVSILGLIFIILDHNNGWVTHALTQNASFLKGALPFFYYLNIASGLVAAYFLIRDYLNEKTPATENEQEFSKRNMIVMGSLVLLGGLTIGGQRYFDSRNPNSQSSISVNPKPNSNAANSEKDNWQGGDGGIENVVQPASTGIVQTKKGSNLRLRSQPSEQAPVIASIPNGTMVSILGYSDHFEEVNGEKGKWCNILFNGVVGWAWGGFIMNNAEKIQQTSNPKEEGDKFLGMWIGDDPKCQNSSTKVLITKKESEYLIEFSYTGDCADFGGYTCLSSFSNNQLVGFQKDYKVQVKVEFVNANDISIPLLAQDRTLYLHR